jgi:hypothetical protein
MDSIRRDLARSHFNGVASREDWTRINLTPLNSAEEFYTTPDSLMLNWIRQVLSRFDKRCIDSTSAVSIRLGWYRLDSNLLDWTRVASIRFDSVGLHSIRKESIRFGRTLFNSKGLYSTRKDSIRLKRFLLDSKGLHSSRKDSDGLDSISVTTVLSCISVKKLRMWLVSQTRLALVG